MVHPRSRRRPWELTWKGWFEGAFNTKEEAEKEINRRVLLGDKHDDFKICQGETLDA